MSPRIKLAVSAVAAALLLAACSSSPNAATAVHTSTAKAAAAPAAAATAAAAPATSAVPSSAAPSPAGLSGTWSGHYNGSYQGTFTLTWTQSGSKLSGTIKISAPASTMDIHGAVDGSSISFGTVGSFGITYSGKISGDSMSGSYQVADGSGGGGPWSAAKAS